MMYKIFFALSTILSLTAIFICYPDYSHEFPVFTDILTVFIFLPLYFIFTFSIVGQVVYIFIKNNTIKTISLFLLFCISFISSLIFFPSRLKIFVSIVCSMIGIVHFAFSITLYNSKKSYNKK